MINFSQKYMVLPLKVYYTAGEEAPETTVQDTNSTLLTTYTCANKVLETETFASQFWPTEDDSFNTRV